jgi:hypothetical protein
MVEEMIGWEGDRLGGLPLIRDKRSVFSLA